MSAHNRTTPSEAPVRRHIAKAKLSPAEKSFLYLIDGHENHEHWATTEATAAEVGLSVRQFKTVRSGLKDKGLLLWEESPGRVTRWRIQVEALKAYAFAHPAYVPRLPVGGSAEIARGGGADIAPRGVQKLHPEVSPEAPPEDSHSPATVVAECSPVHGITVDMDETEAADLAMEQDPHCWDKHLAATGDQLDPADLAAYLDPNTPRGHWEAIHAEVIARTLEAYDAHHWPATVPAAA